MISSDTSDDKFDRKPARQMTPQPILIGICESVGLSVSSTMSLVLSKKPVRFDGFSVLWKVVGVRKSDVVYICQRTLVVPGVEDIAAGEEEAPEPGEEERFDAATSPDPREEKEHEGCEGEDQRAP